MSTLSEESLLALWELSFLLQSRLQNDPCFISFILCNFLISLKRKFLNAFWEVYFSQRGTKTPKICAAVTRVHCSFRGLRLDPRLPETQNMFIHLQGHLHSQPHRHTRRNFLKFPSVVVSFCWFEEILRLKATLQRSLLLLRCPCHSLPLGTVRVRSIRSRSHGRMLLAGSLLPGLGLAFPYIPGPPSQEMMSWIVGWALLHRLRHNNSGSLTQPQGKLKQSISQLKLLSAFLVFFLVSLYCVTITVSAH